jgi:hypothetical protein
MDGKDSLPHYVLLLNVAYAAFVNVIDVYGVLAISIHEAPERPLRIEGVLYSESYIVMRRTMSVRVYLVFPRAGCC